MKIVEFNQGSPEWLTWRREGLGASEISVLTGSNIYSTPLKLWEKKCGFREEDPINPAMAFGIANEDTARQWMNRHYNLNLKPICIEDSSKSHYKASLDGYDSATQTLVEIKCPSSQSILGKARANNAVPDYWYDQMQWQIMLCQPKRAILALWDPDNQGCITVEMFGNSETILMMREEADKFWNQVKTGREPDAKESDFVEVSDPLLEQSLQEYQSIVSQEKVLGDRKKELKSIVEGFTNDQSIQAYGFKVKRLAPRTTYDLDKMREEGIDVDKYKKQGTSYSYRISSPKK